MANRRQPSRSFAASILRLLACTAFVSASFTLSAKAAVQTPRIDDPDVPKIDLLLSGGGLRASAFAYGVLAGLNEICIPIGRTSGRWERREIDSEGTFPDCKKGYSNLLDRVNIISAVSGGAITASYFKSYREEFFGGFPKLLKKSHLERRLLRTTKPFSLKRILRTPVFLLTSILDMAFIPLSLLNLNFEFTPIAVMWLTDGLLESEQLASVYNDLFYQNTRLEELSEKDGVPFEVLPKTGKSSSANDPMLLINATDIANGTVFTFDDRTFECMGVRSERGNVELALAVAASSSLPGVFSPVRIDDILERADPRTIPRDCPAVLANRSRKPVLLDGGITDNLGAVGLLRQVIREKEDRSDRPTATQERDHDSDNPFSHDPRADKHLLLIVNAEAESDSKLPGLAGHFDASYDVLIRSKKDLVRVMASDMFNHFGFRTVELRLSDLVTNEPGIQKIVAGAIDRLTEGRIKREDMSQIVPQSMTSTDQEQKVKRDLERVGMLPSPEEIDTLIAVGRKVVSHRLEDLANSYHVLREKSFASNCSNISNPDKYWCWPDQFRSHDLDSGGGSAFLQRLADVTKDFVAKVAAQREEWKTQMKLEFAERMRMEYAVYPDDFTIDELRHTFDIAKLFIDKDWKLESLYQESGLHKEMPECMRALTTLKNWLAASVEQISNEPRPIPAEKLKNRLHDLKTTLMSGELKSASCAPHYFDLLALPYQIENAAHLFSPHSRGKKGPVSEHQLRLLLEGISTTSSHWNRMNFYPIIGDYLFTYEANFQEGLRYIERGIEAAVIHETTLRSIRHKLSATGSELLAEQLRRMQNAQSYYKVLYALYQPLSLFPIQADPSYVSEDSVRAWEQQHLRTRNGHGILEALTLSGPNRSLEEELDEVIRSKQSWGGLGGNKHLDLLGVELDKIHEILHSIDLQQNFQQPFCSNPHKKPLQDICDLIHEIRVHIRSYLAESSGLAKAKAFIESVHSELEERGLRAWLEPDVLSGYGFLLLVETIDEPCPKRARSVIKAQSLFAKALHLSDDNLAQADNQSGVDIAEKLAEKLRNKRIKMYMNFASELECPGGLY
jgi:predicted acylesterase/phospholipase RssA